MRIGDAAAAAGTTPRALRFYEERGLLPAPRRTASGQRVYVERDVARVRVVRELLSLGLTVADVRVCADRIDLLIAQPGRRCSAPTPGAAQGSWPGGSPHSTPRSPGSPRCASVSRSRSRRPSLPCDGTGAGRPSGGPRLRDHLR
uniref:MerR family transcriptional regulator n=1 Tax=Streptomyces citrinus TaxID=3118173 RepID=UPI003F556BB8